MEIFDCGLLLQVSQDTPMVNRSRDFALSGRRLCRCLVSFRITVDAQSYSLDSALFSWYCRRFVMQMTAGGYVFAPCVIERYSS